jgi:hypothetical protein
MNILLKLCGVGTASIMLITGTISANANIGSDDGTTARVANTGTHVALNPQPLPPRCLPPGCKPGGGGIKAKPAVQAIKPPHTGDDWQQRRQ